MLKKVIGVALLMGAAQVSFAYGLHLTVYNNTNDTLQTLVNGSNYITGVQDLNDQKLSAGYVTTLPARGGQVNANPDDSYLGMTFNGMDSSKTCDGTTMTFKTQQGQSKPTLNLNPNTRCTGTIDWVQNTSTDYSIVIHLYQTSK